MSTVRVGYDAWEALMNWAKIELGKDKELSELWMRFVCEREEEYLATDRDWPLRFVLWYLMHQKYPEAFVS